MGWKDIFKQKNKPVETESAENIDAAENKEEQTPHIPTYEEMMGEFNRLKGDYERMKDNCAHEGYSYEEMKYRTVDIENEILSLYREIRLKQDPEITYIDPKIDVKGTRYTIKSFITKSQTGELNDNNGHGFYASSKGVSNIPVFPSDITHNKYRDDFTHVLWYINEK